MLWPFHRTASGVHCDGQAQSLAVFAEGFTTGNNTVYVPGGAASLVCNHVTFNASAFMSGSPTKEWNHSIGYDSTSRVSGDVPSPATIIGWAKSMLA